MSYVETTERPNAARKTRLLGNKRDETPRIGRVPRPISDQTLASLDFVAAVTALIITLGPLTVYAAFGSG